MENKNKKQPKTYVLITGYKFEQKEYPMSQRIDCNTANITLNIEVIQGGKQVTPEDLTKILNSTQEFYKKNYFDDK